MEDLETGASGALNRPGYAWRTAGCLAGLVAYGAVLGMALQPTMATDPARAWQLIFVFSLLGNLAAGGFFVHFTYRRALDCTFGLNGKAWIAVLAALPTIALPQYGLLVFGAMMFIPSTPIWDDEPEYEDDTGLPRPLQPSE